MSFFCHYYSLYTYKFNVKNFLLKFMTTILLILFTFYGTYLNKDDIIIQFMFPLNNHVLKMNAKMTKEDKENLTTPIRGTITSYYNTRIHPVFNVKKKHNGMDISGIWHDKVRVIKSGKVIDAGVDSGYGNHILVKHGENFYSFYAHLSKIKVKKNQNVAQGQVIGLEGGDPVRDKNHGISTGHHLHFEIRTSENVKNSINPLLFFKEADFTKKKR